MTESEIHEFGHVVGIGHSPNVEDIMYATSRSTATEPTDNDLAACNQAIEVRFGVPSAG